MEDQRSRPNGKARGKSRRKWPWVLAIVLIAIVLLIVLAPIYLSSQGFTRMVLTRINRSTGGTAAIGNLSVGWRKGVSISDFSFQDKAGWAAVSVKTIAAQPRLGALLGGTLSLGRAVIDRPDIRLDLRNRPASAAPLGQRQAVPTGAAGLVVLGDMAINDGTLHLTDTRGKTTQIAQLNSRVNLRAPGQPSSVQANMVIASAGQEATIRASATVRPAKGAGWTLKGTTGDVVVEVNDLALDSLAPIFELAGVQLEAKGQVSANIKSTLEDGKMGSVAATVTGRDLDISGEPLKGDRFKTSRLTVIAKLARRDQNVVIEQLDAQTDWASVKATGAVPMTAKSLADLLKSESSTNLKGDFACDLPALLSQMPHTFALKEGMHITAGKASGSVTTTTQGGRATIAAQTKLVGLAGTMDAKELTLGEPVVANLTLSADEKTSRLDALDVSAAFAKITASGNFENIKYNGTVNLSKLQGELGQFANLGPYQMAGELTSQGQIAVRDKTVGATGSASIKQLVLASADGNSVSEPAANIAFALNLDKEKQTLAIETLDLTGSFGKMMAKNGTVPFGEAAPAPMKVDVTARDVDLKKVKPYAILFGSFPKDIDLAGIAQSQLAVTGQKNAVRIRTDDTRIQNFQLLAPGKTPFVQERVTVVFDVQLDPNDKTINVETLQVDSPQIKIRKGQVKTTRQGKDITLQGQIEGEYDWSAIAPVTSAFMPEGMELTGRRQALFNFTSVYPADEPNQLLANLDSKASVGFDSAKYMGLQFGTADVNVAVVKGVMEIAPFKVAVNNGQLQFAGQASLKSKPTLLRTPGPLLLANKIQLNKEMTDKLLRYINPIFGDLVSISGLASFECETLAIPLAPGFTDQIQVAGTISAENIRLEGSGLLNQILVALGREGRAQTLTIRPTKFLVHNGMVRYDNMQIEIDNTPVNFSGAIGLNGRLDMKVTLPWTLRGRTARVGQEERDGPRIAIPLTGTVTRPELSVEKLIQEQLGEQLLRGLDSLFK